jgi:hypothetical protein
MWYDDAAKNVWHEHTAYPRNNQTVWIVYMARIDVYPAPVWICTVGFLGSSTYRRNAEPLHRVGLMTALASQYLRRIHVTLSGPTRYGI